MKVGDLVRVVAGDDAGDIGVIMDIDFSDPAIEPYQVEVHHDLSPCTGFYQAIDLQPATYEELRLLNRRDCMRQAVADAGSLDPDEWELANPEELDPWMQATWDQNVLGWYLEAMEEVGVPPPSDIPKPMSEEAIRAYFAEAEVSSDSD